MTEDSRVRVAIVGGGVAGLSLAHELSKHHFDVTVYEKDQSLGGLARSQLRAENDRLWPGEHGFRFYPAFYENLIDTLSEIPMGDATEAQRACTVDKLLDGTGRAGIASERYGGVHSFRRQYPNFRELVSEMEGTIRSVNAHLEQAEGPETGDGPAEAAEPRRLLRSDFLNYLERLLQFDVLSQPKKDELDDEIWMSWVNQGTCFGRYSRPFKDVVVSAPRSMVAMEPNKGSARILGAISTQLFYDLFAEEGTVDRVLKGPTSEVWLEPWKEHLERQGVRFVFGHKLERLEVRSDVLVSAAFETDSGTRTLEASTDFDELVLALPVRAAVEHAQSMAGKTSCMTLSALAEVDVDRSTAWMVGIQFFLNEDVSMSDVQGRDIDGHMFYPHSDWALTSILQLQRWKKAESESGAELRTAYLQKLPPDMKEILSVDVSDWFTASSDAQRLAIHTEPEQLVEHIWSQIASSLPANTLDPSMRIGHHLDSGLSFAHGEWTNPTPLLVHPPGDWQRRPASPRTGVRRLMLIGDYVRTQTGLASMEGANESGRMAAAILVGDPEGATRAESAGRPLFAPGVLMHARPVRVERVWLAVRTAVALLNRIPGASVDEKRSLLPAASALHVLIDTVTMITNRFRTRRELPDDGPDKNLARLPDGDAPPPSESEAVIEAQLARTPHLSRRDLVEGARDLGTFWRRLREAPENKEEIFIDFVDYLLGFSSKPTR